MIQFIGMRPTMVTTTSYGSWLPGDVRWYVQRGEALPPEPRLENHAQGLLTNPPVAFSEEQQDTLFAALLQACEEFGYHLSDASIETWHLHWIVMHEDRVPTMAGRLKNRMRQALNMGAIWTEGYHFHELTHDDALRAAQGYIAKHSGVRMLATRLLERHD